MPADSRDMVLVPRAVLEPIAKAAGKLDGKWDDRDCRWNDPTRSGVTVAHIRAVAEALSASPARGEGDAPVAWWSKAERDRAAQAVCGANAIMGREPLSEGASYTFADVVLREVAPPKAVVIENTPEKGGEAHCVDNAVDARDILAGGYDARARRVARAFLELAAAQAEKLVSANTSQTACSETS